MYIIHSVPILVRGMHGLLVSNPFTAAQYSLSVQMCSHHLLNHLSASCGFSVQAFTVFALLQVSEKEEEKATLLTMCNELMNKLEREGISL